MGTEYLARMKHHCGVEGGKSHGGDLAVDKRGTLDGYGAAGYGDPGGAYELMSPHNIYGSGDQDRDAGSAS